MSSIIFVATTYQINFSEIYLKLRDTTKNLWAIVYRDLVWDNKENTFIYEPSPSNRSEDFLKNTRFILEEAKEIATTKYDLLLRG